MIEWRQRAGCFKNHAYDTDGRFYWLSHCWCAFGGSRRRSPGDHLKEPARLVRRAGMSRSAEYRKQAEHCRELANGELLHLYRDEFLNLAQIWERLATQAEREVEVAAPDLRRQRRVAVAKLSDAFTYNCFLCGSAFRFGPHACGGKYINAWDIMICRTCHDATCDGIVPSKDLLRRLHEKGIEPAFNENGMIKWPA
jgi:hypothetical protein